MVSCGGHVISIVLCAFNLIWLVLGGVIIWLGVTVAHFSGNVKEILSKTPAAGAIVLLSIGGVIFVIAFFGFVGACCKSRCMLNSYAALVLLCVIAEGVGAYYAFTYKGDLEGLLKDELTEKIKEYDKEPKIAEAMDNFQNEFSCCGVSSYKDWDSKGPDYPPSCCGSKDKNKRCSLSEVTGKNYPGCVDAIEKQITTKLGSLGGVAIGLVLVQILIVVSACCLAKDIDD